MIWVCRIQRKERGWWGGVFLRAQVWVGGEIKMYLSKRLPKCLRVQLPCIPMCNHRSKHDMFSDLQGDFTFDCYYAQFLCATQQSPIQSQFEQSLLSVQNEAQRTFSLLFPLCRLGRSAQFSCAIRGPICDLISTDGSVSESIACSIVWFSVFFG